MPVSTMVRAMSVAVKAPDVRCPQLVCGGTSPPKPAQSAFEVQATAGCLNALVVLFLQKPQKTFA